MNTFQKIKSTFENEFKLISDKFVVLEENLSDLADSKTKHIYNPGVYIYFDKEKIIKVGRHLTNSRKRALEHIQANTGIEGFEMSKLSIDSNAKVALINVIDPKDYYWVATVEIFLEKELRPIIKSKRN